MLTQWIVKVFGLLVEVGLWMFLVGAIAFGYYTHGFMGAALGLLGWMVVSVVGFGFLLILVDIRDRVERIETSITKAGTKTAATKAAVTNSQDDSEG